MKILATFDESPLSEAIVPVLITLGALPGADIELLSVAEVTAAFDDAAIDGRRRELEAYLRGIANRLGAGTTCCVSTDIAMFPMDAGTVLFERAQSERPDLIVMATHGRTGITRALLGSVAEKVVQSGVPILLVRPPHRN